MQIDRTLSGLVLFKMIFIEPQDHHSYTMHSLFLVQPNNSMSIRDPTYHSTDIAPTNTAPIAPQAAACIATTPRVDAAAESLFEEPEEPSFWAWPVAVDSLALSLADSPVNGAAVTLVLFLQEESSFFASDEN